MHLPSGITQPSNLPSLTRLSLRTGLNNPTQAYKCLRVEDDRDGLASTGVLPAEWNEEEDLRHYLHVPPQTKLRSLELFDVARWIRVKVDDDHNKPFLSETDTPERLKHLPFRRESMGGGPEGSRGMNRSLEPQISNPQTTYTT